MASYFEYPTEDLDRPVPVLLSLRELRALELALGGDPIVETPPWREVLRVAQERLWTEQDRRRVELDRALKHRLPF
ncbi:TPA: hypothetical protein P9G65_005520 [Pseudomonas aeruginosa]|nr:hypothetical protein [Pseudomonas aeruginosa]HDQ4723232.1 hypothetical protein [Pseudomonas aeruginosa]